MSLLLLLYRASRPYIATLGRVPGSEQYGDIKRHPENRAPDGVAVLRVEGGIYFANADAIRSAMLKAAAGEGVRAVVLDAETIPFVDVTAAKMLDELAGDLRRRGGRCSSLATSARSATCSGARPPTRRCSTCTPRPGGGRSGTAGPHRPAAMKLLPAWANGYRKAWLRPDVS